MENKQTITNWSIFYNRKLNQAQWRSLKNGPMRLTHPEKKQFKKVRDVYCVQRVPAKIRHKMQAVRNER